MVRKAIALVTLLGFAGAGDDAALEKLLDKARLTLAEAVDLGLARAGEGAVFHAELEEDKGRPVYSVDVAQGKKTCNVVLDATEGTVVERLVEDEDHAAAAAACRIALKAAVERALAAHPGRAVEAKLSLSTGKPVVTVHLLDGGKRSRVRVDGATGALLDPGAAREAPYTDAFPVDPSELATAGRNPWFSLEPGHVLVLEDETTRLTITVLDETVTVDGVETRVVEEREEEGGKLVEVSRNFFAVSRRTNGVYYFGEDVDEYEDGKVVGHAGAWRSGRDGARFGLMMPGEPLLGARYHQEVAPGVAMDRAEVVSLTARQETPAGAFTGCLEVKETTPLEEGKEERKTYARGVGLIRDGSLRLARKPPAK